MPTMSLVSASDAAFQNPLDIIEDIVVANEWLFERARDDEMVVELAGRWCHYRLFFVWQADISALQFSCQFDLKVPVAKRPVVYDLLAVMNSKLWLGHFELCPDDASPMFRHTLLIKETTQAPVEMLEDLVEIALTESERFYPAFQFVVWGGKTSQQALAAAMIDTAGQA